jgi:hypothetical protein
MAIASALCTSFKQEILQGLHLSSHTYKIALFSSAASLDAATISYTGQTGEVANGNGYTTGGVALSGFTTSKSGTTAWLDFTSDPSWANATITARGALIYNDTLAGKNAVAVLDFGADKTSTNGTFQVTFPSADASNALIRIA